MKKAFIKNDHADFLICGGGIVGLTVARELVLRGHENIVIVEKESGFGLHASGRNSGVLHAGIYYAPDSLRAKMCLSGNRLMKEYCRQHGIPVLETGKVVVAKNDREVETLRELGRRATANGARVDLIDETQLAKIEPIARTCGTALFSHETAVVDPKMILAELSRELLATGKVAFRTGTTVIGFEGSLTAVTTQGAIEFDQFINAAGAHSDTVAHLLGVGRKYRIVPFKGIYRKLSSKAAQDIRGSIYPVPDIRNPFLGVHFTRSVHGEVYLGPTAIPALGRENYGIVSGIDREAPEIIYRDSVLFARNPKFRIVAMTEPRKYFFPFFFADARALVKHLDKQDVIASSKVGIRPQLVDWESKELVMDFLVVRDGAATHILNAISPAFTSSMAFARFVVDEYIETRDRKR